MPYDERILSHKAADRIRILTPAGRILVPIVFGPYCADRLGMRCGQADLICRDGTFTLSQTIDVPTPPRTGLASIWASRRIATDSDGEAFSGAKVKGLRHRLQEQRTRSARAPRQRVPFHPRHTALHQQEHRAEGRRNRARGSTRLNSCRSPVPPRCASGRLRARRPRGPRHERAPAPDVSRTIARSCPTR